MNRVYSIEQGNCDWHTNLTLIGQKCKYNNQTGPCPSVHSTEHTTKIHHGTKPASGAKNDEVGYLEKTIKSVLPNIYTASFLRIT